MGDNSKKPGIRFKGFTDDWEQRKLGDVFQEYSEKNHPELPALTIIQGGGTVLREESERKLQYDKWSLAGYKMVREDDFIVHLRSFEGGLEKSNHNGLISPAYHTFHSDEVDSRFYYPYFRSYEFIKHKLVPHVYGIRDGRSIDIDGMKTIEIPWTSYEEQKKIGDYIESLDTLITLHQRKYDKLVVIKKSMLEKMFPKNGQTKPEIRFSGFTDDWEQRKFSEGVSEIGDGLHGTPIYCEDGNVYFINGNNLVDGKIVISAETKKVNESQQSTADKSLDDTTILMSINGTIGNLAYYSGERLMLGKSAAYIKVSEFDKRFVYAYLQAPSVQEYFMDSLTGTTIKNLGLKAIREMIMFIPQDVDEQKRIGKFLDYLDHLITLHQRELEKLKKIKLSMLEKMFV